MILDLKRLRASGKEESSFHFEYAPDTPLTDIPSVNVKAPVSVTGKITLTGRHSAYIECEVAFVLSGPCTRCLKDTERGYTAEFAEEVRENNTDGYSVVNDTVDLKKIADDSIMINSPVNFLCRDDCRGICAGCGADLNAEECRCEK